jgi:hypothetical protein
MSKWEDTLAQYQKDYAEAQEFSDWMPPVGEYTVVLGATTTGTFNKDGAELPFRKPIVKIVAGDLENKEFALGYFTPKNFGMLKGLAKVLNGGQPVPDVMTADATLKAKAGAILTIRVFETPNKKNPGGPAYINCRVTGLVQE